MLSARIKKTLRRLNFFQEKNMKITNKLLLSVLVLTLVLLLGLLAGCSKPAPAPSPAPAAPTGGSRQMHNPTSLVNVAELKELMERDDVVVVDVSERANNVIPGAIWIDRNSFHREVDGNRQGVQTLEVHEQLLGQNGIGNDTIVILYCDNNNLHAARIFWQLRGIGHRDLRLLDGGTKAWVAAGESTQNSAAAPGPARTYRAINRMGSVRADLADVLDATNNPNWSILDIRNPTEFGRGRVPGATLLTYPGEFVNENGTFKAVQEYERLFANIPRTNKIIVYCGSSVRSSTAFFILTEFLGWPHRVLNYEGSWNNYSWSNSPVER